VVGKTLTLDGTDYTVIGVLPTNFYFDGWDFRLSDVYAPIGASGNAMLRERKIHPGIFGIGRLKPGVTFGQAQADMDGVARNLAAAYPDANTGEGVTLTPLKEHMVRDIQPFLLVLLAAVGFVLLIACVNVANLLLARSTGRAREFAIRAALGASQGRVIRQLLTESVMLAIAGGGLGLLLASWGTKAALAALPEALPRANDIGLDSRVLLFTLAVSLIAGIVFGLAPALKTSRPDLHETLKEGGRGSSGTRYRTQGIFVAVEMALAVVLLIGAGLTIRSLALLWDVNPGFDSHNVLTFNVAFPPPSAKITPEQIRAEIRGVLSKAGSVPGVTAVSAMDGATPMNGDSELPFWIDGQPKPASQNDMGSALWYEVSPDYLKVMRVPLLRGSFLSTQDDEHSPRVCVIDEAFARQYFKNEDPLGKRVHFAVPDLPMEVVGVV
ncbi:MAG: ABC transporter permease, partial [Candidatus Acidiferrales bacterium]